MKRALLVVLLATAGLGLIPPAEAASCSDTTGVLVVVQFPDGHIESGCAGGNPSNGIDALHQAGFSTSPVPQQPEAVCTIKGQPADHNCWSPPKSWSYWHAQRGGSWSFSNEGAATYHPAPGSVEGWRFDSNAAPTVPPPPAANKPIPTAKPTHHASHPAPATTSTPTATPTATSTPKRGPGRSPSATPKPTPTSTPILTPGPTFGPKASAHAVASKSGGLSWIWGLALLAVLGVLGGIATALRRRG